MEEQDQKRVRKLTKTLKVPSAQNKILKDENEGFREALYHEKRRRKRGQNVFELVRAEQGQGSLLFTPRQIKTIKELAARREQEKQEEKAAKQAKAED